MSRTATQVDVLDADSGEVKGTIADTQGRPRHRPGSGPRPRLHQQRQGQHRHHLRSENAQDPRRRRRHRQEPRRHRLRPGQQSASSPSTAAAAAPPSSTRPRARWWGPSTWAGKPEFAAADGAGNVFVNLEDKDTLVKIDAKKMTVLERWPLAPGEAPSAHGDGPKTHRLFVGCHNKMMVVVNAETGKVVADRPIGERRGRRGVRPGDRAGLLLLRRRDRDGRSTRTGRTSTAWWRRSRPSVGSKTMALDRKTHDLFLPSADFKPAPAPTADNPRPRPAVVPGTFAVLRFGK